MIGSIGSAATRKTMERLAGPSPAGGAAGALTEAGYEAPPLAAQNAAAELAERSGAAQYPAISVYCEKIVNDFREKFRTFSGTAQMAIEARHSQDRLEGLEEALEGLTDAITSALTASRGDWGDGMYYSGGYVTTFGRVSRGGKNFAQVAKVTFEIGVNKN